ncbi:MAG: DUF362 domain-containing protein [Anaerolineales bacterium]
MVKPNVVIAHPQLFAHAYTRAEFLDGLLQALQSRADGMSELLVGERCGITIPTRYAFAMAGYPSVLKKRAVRAEYFDEGRQVPVQLHDPAALRSEVMIPEAVVGTQFLVNAPKFKAHPWTKVTFSLKNYIGIQHDPQRLIDHDHKLHSKIVDLQEVIRPGLIAIDGITAGQRTMLTPSPYPLHLIVLGVNPVAVDSVCSRIIGLDPNSVEHIRLAHERGFGPLALEDIEICGDVSLAEAQTRGAGLQLTVERVDTILNQRGSQDVHVGTPPDTYDYCWGGCPGSLFEATEIIRQMQPAVHQEMRPMQFVIGDYHGHLDANWGRPIFVGDCTKWNGILDGQTINIESKYIHRANLDPHHAHSADALRRAIGVIRNLIRHRGKPYLRVRGCPVSVAELVLYSSVLGRTKNPYLVPEISVRYLYYYLVSKAAFVWRRAWRRHPSYGWRGAIHKG